MAGSKTNENDEEFQELFKRAATIAASVPEAMQEAAFNRALDMLSGNYAPQSQVPTPGAQVNKPGKTAIQGDGGNDPVETLLSMDRTIAGGVDDEDNALNKGLALLRVAYEHFQIDGLTSPQIAQILTDKFRWRVSRQAITQAFDRAGRLVDPVPGKGAAKYRLMEAGILYLDTPTDQRKLETSVPRKRSSKNGKQDSGATATGKQSSESPKAGKKKSSRMGPRAAIEGLIASGFFSTPRAIKAMQDELDHNQGLRFKTGDLASTLTRLLRDQKLKRARNADNQYEYVTP